MKQRFIRKNNRHVVKELYSGNNTYFITICVRDRSCVFKIVESNKLNPKNEISNSDRPNGDTEAASTTEIVIDTLFEVVNFCSDVELVDWVVMPNHLHFIIKFGHNPMIKISKKIISISDFVQSFKVRSQKLIVEAASVSPFIKQQLPSSFNYHKLWQKSYYDHVIRDEQDLIRIREYIINNPSKWDLDILNPMNDLLYMERFGTIK